MEPETLTKLPKTTQQEAQRESELSLVELTA